MGVRPSDPGALADKQAITEVIHRYCRGLDRMDRELTLSCWHPGGTDDHAPLYVGTATGFVDWVWPVHAAMKLTRHVVSNTLIELRGDEAGAETYWTVTLRIPHDGRLFDVRSGGRYLDLFERVDGVWAIRHRQSIREWSRTDEVSVQVPVERGQSLIEPNDPDAPVVVGKRDRCDFSYRLIGQL